MADENKNEERKDLIDNIKEKSTEFATDAKEALEIAKDKVNEALSEENIEKVKQKAEIVSEIAKEKAIEFAAEAKENFDDLKENASEIASDAAEHLADFAEDAKEEITEVKEKSKNFLKRLFGK